MGFHPFITGLFLSGSRKITTTNSITLTCLSVSGPFINIISVYTIGSQKYGSSETTAVNDVTGVAA
jgi:hypothetical protein